MKLLSIIIPVFGVEDYIAKFLDSLLPQLKAEVECIFVDDGCTDRSMEIAAQRIDRFACHPYVKIIRQQNAGLSAARNTGLRCATGQYITFLDSDDYVCINYIDTILQAIQQHSFDIMHFNAHRETKRGKVKTIALVDAERQLVIDQAYLESVTRKNHWYAWMRVFKRDLVADFNFPVGLLIEDSLSFPYLYRNGLKVFEQPLNLVFYRYRQGSIMRKKVSEKLLASYRAGISQFRTDRTDKYFCELYKNFIVYSLNDYRKMGYREYCQFLHDFDEDIAFLKKHTHLYFIKEKDKVMLFHPKLHFFCKTVANFILHKK